MDDDCGGIVVKEGGKNKPRGRDKNKVEESMLKERVGKEGGTGDRETSDDGLVVSAGAVLSLRAEKSMRAGTRKHRSRSTPQDRTTPHQGRSLILNPRKLWRWKAIKHSYLQEKLKRISRP